MRFICYTILLIASLNLFSQNKEVGFDQDFHNYFYDQRRSFFEAMPDSENDVIMLGNSITNGASWDELFPDVKIKNRGISGDITLGILDRLDEVTKRKPTKVFILIGINDIAKNIPADTIIANYQSIINKIKKDSPQSKIYVQGVMPTNDEFSDFKNHQGKMAEIKKLNHDLEQLAKTNNLSFINLFDPFLDSNGKLSKKYTNDGLHLLGEGYVLWSSILKKYIYE